EGAANGTTKIDPKQLQPAWTMWHPWAGPPATTPQDIPVIAAVARLLAAPEVPIKPAYRDIIAGWDVPIETGAITQENLDDWVNKSTAGLVNKSGIDVTRGDINFVLQNAITFAARWRERFNANKTRQSRFTKTTGETIMVDMMWLSRTTAPYTVSDGWRGVRLDYTDGELAAFVLIPDTDPGQVTPTMLKQAVSQLCRPNETTGLVRVGLPKLRLTTKKDLIPFLKFLGLAGNIDLPTMTNANPIDITQAVQQAIMLVDEEGTVASVVTEVGGLAAAPGTIPKQPIDIIADRPFYLVIGDVATGTPLFLSRISDPAA
ncbi:MAG: serpin family protein, partial [Corynebacterium matruchotii]